MELRYLWQILMRRKLVIVLSIVGTLLAAILVCLRLPPVFETVAQVKVKRVDETHMLMAEPPNGYGTLDFIAPTAAVTQAQVIKSAAVVEPVIEKLNLIEKWCIVDTVVSYVPFIKQSPKELARADDLADTSIAYWFLQGRALFAEAIEDSDVVEITAYSEGLEEAKNLANEVVASYLRFNEAQKAKAGDLSTSVIARRVSEAVKELEKAQAALKDFQEKEGALNLTDQSKALVEQISSLDAQLADVRRSLRVNEASVKGTEAELARQSEFNVSSRATQANPIVDSMKQQLSDLKSKLSALSVDLKPEHIEVLSIKAQIQVIEELLRAEPGQRFASEESTRNAYRDMLVQRLSDKMIERQELKVKEGAVSEDFVTFRRALSSLAGTQSRQTSLQLAVDVAQKAYTDLTEDYRKALLSTSAEVVNVSVITPAPIPDKSNPFYPSWGLYIVIALICGPLIGFGLALLVDYVDGSMKTREDIQRALGLPVFATFRRIAWWHPRSNRGHRVGASHTKALMELRFALRGAAAEDGKRMVVVTSSIPKEGKSTIAEKLGTFLADDGTRVVLVDLNLGAPVLHRRLHARPSPGICALLEGQASLTEAVRATATSNLDLIECGAPSAAVAEAFHLNRLSEVFGALRAAYDVIIVDTSALTRRPEGQILASLADAVLLVVVPGRTPESMALDARGRLQTAGAKNLGIVLNKV
ncbi:MAG: hypothetical protein HY900_14750 [Deltaproteobacteria bacterium]|nr:hypothetical protein [Deltaproteobacteria bacterium]